MQDLSEEFTSSGDKIWPKLNLLFGAMIALVIGVTVLYRTMPVVSEKASQDARIAKLEEAIDKAEMTNKRLVREVDALHRDPEYAGIVARDRLNLVREGETILRIEPKK